MGCCSQREKFDNPDNEQKWDYIVRCFSQSHGKSFTANVCALEFVRLSLLILSHSFILRGPLHLPPHQRCRLRRRSFHMRQSAIF